MVCVLIAFIVGAAVAVASFYFALKWRFEVEHEAPPTVVQPKSPPGDALVEQARLLHEWFEGKGEEVE